MGSHLGDFSSGSILFFTWDTNDGNGASVDPTVDGTISVYKDAIIVPTVAGITDTRNYNGITGLHNVEIDTADVFYAIEHDYHVILEACTIDGQVVNATLAEFSIEHRLNPVDTDLALHLGATIGRRNIGAILPQIAQSEFTQRENFFATAPIPAQGIDINMVARGCVQFQRVYVSYTKNFAVPDFTYDDIYYYDTQKRIRIMRHI